MSPLMISLMLCTHDTTDFSNCQIGPPLRQSSPKRASLSPLGCDQARANAWAWSFAIARSLW